jgi:DHA2 family multidrug resistance protein
MFSFVLGIGLYGLTYLYPIYLAQIRGFNALMIGQTLFISGATMFLTAPLVGRLMTKVDARWMLAFGFAVVALSNWQMTYLTKDWEFWQLFLPQLLRGFGMMFAIVPITNISLGTLAPERLKNASGLFNLTRNLGGAVGLAGLNTVLDKRIDLHLARLHDSITLGAPPGGGSAHRLCRAHAGLRRAKHGAQATFPVRTPAGYGDGLCRRVPAAVPVVRRLCLSGVLATATADGRSSHG